MPATSLIVILLAVVFGGFFYANTQRNERPSDHHGLFLSAPSDQIVTLKSGVKTTVPFHAENAHAVIIAGTADSNKIKELMKGQDFHPLVTEDNKAIAVLWFVSYPNSTGGAYHELAWTILSSRQPKQVTWNQDPFRLAQFFLDYSTVLYIHKIWLDEQLPLQYGIEILGTDKHMMKNLKDKRADTMDVNWQLPNGETVVQADVLIKPSIPTMLISMVKTALAVGIFKSVKLLTSPFTYTLSSPKGINPEVDMVSGGENVRYHIKGFGDVTAFPYDTATDKLIFGKDLSAIQFTPQLKLVAPSFDFVFYPPIMSPTTLRK